MYTRASPTDILARKSARPRKTPLQSAGCRPAVARAARRLPREDPREEVGEEVRVGVGDRVGLVEFKLNRTLCNVSQRVQITDFKAY